MSRGLNPLPGAEHIRSLESEDAVYTAFDAYPWKKDKMFIVSSLLTYQVS
jgi:hypothetical protein